MALRVLVLVCLLHAVVAGCKTAPGKHSKPCSPQSSSGGVSGTEIGVFSGLAGLLLVVVAVIGIRKMRERQFWSLHAREADAKAAAAVMMPPLGKGKYDDVCNAPERFYCPISQGVMEDPVTCCDGCHDFERSHIERYLALGNEQCPLSRNAMKLTDLTKNPALKDEIDAWVSMHPESVTPLSKPTPNDNCEPASDPPHRVFLPSAVSPCEPIVITHTESPVEAYLEDVIYTPSQPQANGSVSDNSSSSAPY
ncbi:Protein spotted leaf 11 [Diplonema papillatum]|nr:Protein spotted leaf 11 [Diplonema papillatum]